MKRELCGARVGGSIDDVDFGRVTSIEPRSPNQVRTYPDPRSRDVLLAELRTFGGRAYVDQSCIEIVDGRVTKVWLRGSTAARSTSIRKRMPQFAVTGVTASGPTRCGDSSGGCSIIAAKHIRY